MPSKKNVFLWSFYDFANSLAFANVSVYFSLWFVSDHRYPDSWISGIVASVTILLLFTLPVLGVISDRRQKRMPFLIALTAGSIATLAGLGIIAVREQQISQGILLAVIALYFLFQYFYQASLSFYDAFLQDISAGQSPEKISGYGLAAGQLGNIIGLLLILPIASGNLAIFGLSGRNAVFLFSALLFLIFSMPTLIWLKDSKRAAPRPHPAHGYFKETYQNFKRIKQHHGIFNYLIAYYFFADAILTLQIFASLYLQEVGRFNDVQKVAITIAGLLFIIAGSLASHSIAKFFGNTRMTIKIFLLLWAFFLALLAASDRQIVFIWLSIFNGFSLGVLFALSRAYYSEIVPKDRQTEFFSIYGLFERTASVLGPIIWSGTALAFASYGPDKYRFSVLSLAILILISFVILHSKEEDSYASA